MKQKCYVSKVKDTKNKVYKIDLVADKQMWNSKKVNDKVLHLLTDR